MSDSTLLTPPLVLNRWQRLLLPNLPAIAALTLLYLALGLLGPDGFLNDSDTGWHIVTGERILDTFHLPRTDPYSFSKTGEPWFAWEWLADVMLGGVHRKMGLAGVVLLAVFAVAATAWMWCAFALWLGSDRFVIAALMAVAITASTIHWHARPHVFSWPLLIGWLWLLEKTPERVSPRRLLGLFVLMALWTNLHGSFFLAFLLSGAYALEFWFRRRSRAVTALAEAGVALLATFCNPYGWHLHQHLVRYLTNPELLGQISEYQSPSFHGKDGIYLLALFLLAMAGAVLTLEQRRFARSLVVLLLAATGLRAARGIPIIAFAALPLAAAAFTELLGRFRPLKEIFEESANFGRIERQTNGALLLAAVGLVLVLWSATPQRQKAVQFPEKRFPVRAALAVARLDPAARLFAPDYYGGYLIYRFRGTRKVFFDGRSDFYGTKFLDDYGKWMLLKPGWRGSFTRAGFSHALLPEDHPLREVLECSGWRRIHADRTAVLLERPAAALARPVCPMP